MNAVEVICLAAENEVTLSLESGVVVFDGDVPKVESALPLLREHKAEILAHLQKLDAWQKERKIDGQWIHCRNSTGEARVYFMYNDNGGTVAFPKGYWGEGIPVHEKTPCAAPAMAEAGA